MKCRTAARITAVLGVTAAMVATSLPALAQQPSNAPGSAGRPVPATPHALSVAGVPAVLDALGQGTGPVTIMLQLPQEPSLLTWRHASKTSRTAAGRQQKAAIEQAQGGVLNRVKAVPGAHVLYRVSNSYNGVAVTVSRQQATKLLAIPGVSAVHVMKPLKLADASTDPTIGAPQAWASNGGLTGQGVRVGVIDSGIDYTHKDLGGDGNYAGNTDHNAIGDSPDFPNSKVVGGYDFAGDAYNGDNAASVPVPDPDPIDCPATSGSDGHGTHVAGILAGGGENADGSAYTGSYDSTTPLDHMLIAPGVAPKAQLYALKISGCDGGSNLLTKALDWAMDPNGDGNFADHLDVVNMSIGSEFGLVDDPDAVATNNAVAAGIQVVVSAGNDSDLTYVTSSPAIATRAVSVANAVDAGQPSDAFRFTSGGVATNYGGNYGVAYDWTGKPDVTAPLYVPTNRTGCLPFTGADATNAAGRILLENWDPVAGSGDAFCDAPTRAKNAGAVGAAGVVVVWTGSTFSALDGDAVTPLVLTDQPVGDKLLSAVPVGSSGGSVTFSGALLHGGMRYDASQANTIWSKSSRGPSLETNALKPDISGPGTSVWSATSATGSAGKSMSGTSMAAPHVAGMLALLHQKLPAWSPEELKALAMNTAGQDLYNTTNGVGSKVSPVRQGAGLANIPAALNSSVVAYGTDNPGGVSLSFGSLQVLGTQTAVRTIAVVNKGTSAASYALGVDPRGGVAGVSYDFPDGNTVNVAAGASATVRLRLTAVGTQVDAGHDPNLAAKQTPLYGDTTPVARSFNSESTGFVTLTPTGTTSGSPLRLPYLAVVRPASNMTTPDTLSIGATPGTGTLHLTGTGVDNGAGALNVKSLVTPLQLAGTKARNTSVAAAGDLKAVGVATTRAAELRANPTSSAGNLVFGVATYAPRTSPAYGEGSGVRIEIDTNNDGTFDYELQAARQSGTDAFLTTEVSLTTGLAHYGLPLNMVPAATPSALFNNDVLSFGVPVASLGMPSGSTTLRWQAFAYASVNGAQQSSSLGTFTYDVAHPGLDFSGAGKQVVYDDKPGATLPVSFDPANYAAQAGKGVLLLHHFNVPGDTAQIVPVSSGPATVRSLQVSPSAAVIVKGDAGRQLTAKATMSDGSTVDLTSQADWSSSSPAVVVGNLAATKGLVTGAAVGNATVTATVGGQSGSAYISVSPALLSSIQLTPPDASLPKGTTQQMSATGVYSDGTTQDLTAVADWATSSATVATVNNVAAKGLLTAAGTGTSTITATYGGLQGITTATVTAAVLTSIGVTPALPSIARGTDQQFTATGVYSDSSTIDLTSQATWSSSAASATVSNAAGTRGLAHGAAEGPSTISATLGAVSGSTTLTVTPAVLSSIAVTPSSSQLAKGTGEQLTALGTYSDGGAQDLTSQVTWASDSSHVTVSNVGPTRGFATAQSVGASALTATLGSVTGAATVTVTPATLVSIGVSPAAPSLAKGTTQQLTATGTYSDGTTQVLTASASWTSNNPAVVAVSSADGSRGLVTALAAGTGKITATFSAIAGSTTVNVTAVSVRSIQVTPANARIAKGSTLAYTATGTFTDGSVQDLTTQVAWLSTGSAASISNSPTSQGLAKGAAAGTTTIKAVIGGVTGSTSLTVTAAALTTIKVTPTPVSVAKGDTKAFTATATYSDGTTRNVTQLAMWSSTGGVQLWWLPRGFATAVKVGPATVTAVIGTVRGSASITVTPPVARWLLVTPFASSVAAGSSRQFTATTIYSDGTTKNVTASATWSSSAPSKATVSDVSPHKGLIRGVARGTANIKATYAGFTAIGLVRVF
jgi:uncharacterized protein YjdB